MENLMYTGPFTVEEANNCLKIGTVVADEDCSFGIREKSTICEGESFDENLANENICIEGTIESNVESSKDAHSQQPVQNHRKGVKKTLKEKLKCNYCPRVFRTIPARYQHQQFHKEPLKCFYEACSNNPKTFTQNVAFRKHVRNFHAEIWAEEFATLAELQRKYQSNSHQA